MSERLKFIFSMVISASICFVCGILGGLMGTGINSKAEVNEPTQAEIEPITAIYETASTTETTVCEETTESLPTSLGVFEVTAYCGCERCCGKSDGITATGTKATEGRTIAVDPDVIPYGTVVVIDGQEYVAEDCGGAVIGSVVDIFFDSHEEALQYGRQTHEVYIRG